MQKISWLILTLYIEGCCNAIMQIAGSVIIYWIILWFLILKKAQGYVFFLWLVEGGAYRPAGKWSLLFYLDSLCLLHTCKFAKKSYFFWYTNTNCARSTVFFLSLILFVLRKRCSVRLKMFQLRFLKYWIICPIHLCQIFTLAALIVLRSSWPWSVFQY